MELVRGRSLDDIVQQDGTMASSEAAHVGIDCCSALVGRAWRRLLHRDVKAQNVHARGQRAAAC